MKRLVFCATLASVSLLLCAGAAPAAEDEPGFGPLPPKGERPRATPAERAAALKKDPVQMAFALPPGLVLTPKEFEYAAKVRNQLEPPLRDALERIKTSTDQKEKLKAVKEVKAIKQQIQAAIFTIVQARQAAMMKEYAKREAARREALRKKQGQQRKNKNRRKKRKR